jgi:hypothetical protein
MGFEMSKIIIGLLVILLLASFLSAGLYLLVQNGTINVQLLGEISNLGRASRGEGLLFVPARQPLGYLASDSFDGSGFGLGNRFLIGLNDILHNLFLIAGITMAVVLVEKVLSAFRAKSHTASLK